MLLPPVLQHLTQHETSEGSRHLVIASNASNIAARSRITTTHFTR
jgi:uncharacterized membrane protein